MDDNQAIANTARMGIFVAAMTVGVLAFTGVAFALGPVAEPEVREGLEILRLVVLALPLLELGMLAQIWMIMGRRMQTAESTQAKLAAYRSRMIIAMALVEAPALLAGVVILMLGFSWHVIPALVVFVAGVAAVVPTPGRIKAALGMPQDKYK